MNQTHFVDFDGTLAFDSGWKGYRHLGKPIPAMVSKIKGWLADGDKVCIYTSRVLQFDPGNPLYEPVDTNEAIGLIQDWTEKHVGSRLEVVPVRKDWTQANCWDDRVRRIVPNSGGTPEELTFSVLDDFIELAEHDQKVYAVDLLRRIRSILSTMLLTSTSE